MLLRLFLGFAKEKHSFKAFLNTTKNEVFLFGSLPLLIDVDCENFGKCHLYTSFSVHSIMYNTIYLLVSFNVFEAPFEGPIFSVTNTNDRWFFNKKCTVPLFSWSQVFFFQSHLITNTNNIRSALFVMARKKSLISLFLFVSLFFILFAVVLLNVRNQLK